jgi:hypothetical protein
MTDRIPDERADRGGMTGATGNLTSDNEDEEFVPAETRALTDPVPARQLTADGLEEHAAPAAPSRPARGRDTALGGDERRHPEDEHL